MRVEDAASKYPGITFKAKQPGRVGRRSAIAVGLTGLAGLGLAATKAGKAIEAVGAVLDPHRTKDYWPLGDGITLQGLHDGVR
jgi:hypothetical protein